MEPEIRDEHIPQVSMSNLSGSNENSPTPRERAESTSSIESLGNLSEISDNPEEMQTQVSIELQDIFELVLFASKPPDVASIEEKVEAQEPSTGIAEQIPEIRDEHISQIALSNLSGGNMNSPTQRERAKTTSKEQALVPSSSQLAASGNEAGGQQTMMPVDISEGRFENAQLGGHRTYNITKKENISGDIQYGRRKINVHNYYYGAGPRTQAQEDKNTAQAMFRLSDTIHMNKEKPLNPRKTIFYGEQISSVTAAQPLAIKLIPYEEKNKKEANLLLSLERHPNVISFIHSGVCHQGPLSSIYIAMDLCHEKNLHDHVHENKAGNAVFDPKQSISQAKQIIEGLKHIHKSKIVHRDLKPQNILLSRDRNNVIIADFGISKPMTSGRTNTDVTNSRAGTDGFRAPETYNSDVISRKADIFSLGLVLYFLWSNGHHAYGDDPDDWNSNIKKNRDRDLSHLLVPDKEIAIDLLEWILQYRPGDRPTAAQILNHRMFGGSELAPKQKTQPKDEKERSTEGQPASIPLMTNNKARDEPSNVKAQSTPSIQRSHSVGDDIYQTMFSLKDKAEKQLKDGDYRSAHETLQNLRAIQQHPTDKLGTLKEIIECQLLTNQPHIDEINEITSICRSIGRSPDDMRSAGDQHFRDSLPVHAYIMYMCANKMYKTDSSPTDAVAGMRQCISCIGDCVARMVQQDHLRGLVSNRVIPSMREMLTGLSSKDVPGNEMVKNEAECVKIIGFSYSLVGEYEKAQNSFKEGVELFNEQFKSNSLRYKVYGRLFNELGLLSHNQGKYNEAANHYEQAIDAIQKAEDFPTEADKRNEIDGMKSDLENSKSQKPPSQRASLTGWKDITTNQAASSGMQSTEPKKVFAKPSKPSSDVLRTGGAAVQGSTRINKTETDIKEMITLKAGSWRILSDLPSPEKVQFKSGRLGERRSKREKS